MGPSVWVKKWVDYTSKYGLGYLLTNGLTGVFFNDSTKIILDVHGRYDSPAEMRIASSTISSGALPTSRTLLPFTLSLTTRKSCRRR